MMIKNIKFIWVDGQIVNPADSHITILTHGLHYGSGVFEGIRAYNGNIFKMREHYERFYHSAHTINMNIKYSIDELCTATQKILEINNLKDAYIRPIAFQEADTLRLNAQCKTKVTIAAWPLKNYFAEGKIDQGIKVGFSHLKKPSQDFLPFNTKICGLYVLNQIAKNYYGHKFDDVIMLDWRGYITECSTSNLFMVKNNILLTPIADCFLNGITRQTIITLAKNLNIPCEEKYITPEELLGADEIFITGTAIEIMPIIAIEDINFTTGTITKQITKAYRELCNHTTNIAPSCGQ